MKYILTYCLFLVFTFGYSQNFDGDYRCYETSFKSKLDSTQSFKEETLFNVAIHIDELKDDGIVSIQDPRIPDKLLLYKIESYTGILENNGYDMYIYKAITEHLTAQEETTIVFYYDIEKNLNLMISSSDSSQSFFDLQIQ